MEKYNKSQGKREVEDVQLKECKYKTKILVKEDDGLLDTSTEREEAIDQ